MQLFQKYWMLVTLALLVGEMVTAQDSSQSPEQEEDHKPAANQKQKDIMSYIETSQFRRNFPLDNIVPLKTSVKKYPGIVKKEIPTIKKEAKLKNSFFPISGKKLFKQIEENKLAMTAKNEEKHVVPPVPFNEEIFWSIPALPSNEEYDSNSRFQHSFLYGYDRF